MIVPAATLKSALKRLTAVKSEQFTYDTGSGLVAARDQELEVRALTRALAFEDARDHHVLNINLRRISAAANKLSGDVTITPSERGITLASKRTSFNLEAATGKNPAGVVPPPPVILPLQRLLGLLKFAATSAETNRASAFGGVVQLKSYIGFEDDSDVEYEAAGVSGGGNCLAVATGDGFKQPAVQKMHIPLAAVRALQDLTADNVSISETESLLIFRVTEGDTAISIHASKLAKQFPEYGSFIPKQFKFIASIEPATMKEALDAVAPMIGQDARDDAGAIFLVFKDEKVTVRTVSTQNAAEDSAPYTANLGGEEERTYLLRHNHLTDFFAAAKEPVIFSGNSGNEPVVLQAGAIKIVLAATIIKG